MYDLLDILQFAIDANISVSSKDLMSRRLVYKIPLNQVTTDMDTLSLFFRNNEISAIRLEKHNAESKLSIMDSITIQKVFTQNLSMNDTVFDISRHLLEPEILMKISNTSKIINTIGAYSIGIRNRQKE